MAAAGGPAERKTSSINTQQLHLRINQAEQAIGRPAREVAGFGMATAGMEAMPRRLAQQLGIEPVCHDQSGGLWPEGGQIDISARAIRWAEQLRWAWDVRWPDEQRLAAKLTGLRDKKFGSMTKQRLAKPGDRVAKPADRVAL